MSHPHRSCEKSMSPFTHSGHECFLHELCQNFARQEYEGEKTLRHISSINFEFSAIMYKRGLIMFIVAYIH